MPGLFLDSNGPAALIELDHTISLGRADLVAKDRGTRARERRLAQHCRQTIAVKDIVAEHQRDGALADELAPDEKSLCEPVGFRLLGIADRHPPLAAILEQALKS